MNAILQLTILILLLFVQSCKQNIERSDIEIIKYDMEIVTEIISTYDSTYTEYAHQDDFWTIEHYLIDSTKENLIFRDSKKNIVGIVKRANGKNYYTEEFYPNGQLKGKVTYSSPGIFNGPSTLYFKDGRISSLREWKDNNKVGEWKFYDKKGRLKSIEYYNDNGKLVRIEKIK